MKSKTMVWFSSTLIGAIVALALLITHMAEIDIALPFILYGGGGLAALYVLHNVLHKMRTKQLDRATAQALLAKVESEKWAVEQRVLTELESVQTKEQNHLQIELEKIRLDQMRAQLEHERLMLAAQYSASQVTLNEGQTLVKIDQTTGAYLPYQAPARAIAQKTSRQVVVEDEQELPVAPAFPEMSHLLSAQKMVLCYTSDGPAYGTTDDLLSMIITGKPGRGKTTALMYYVVMLLQAGAEVWVWDPHGAMNELAVLNGRRLPGMPATAKVVYLDRKPDIVASVPKLQAELADRDELYRPAHEVKHPLLLLADELPVLADYDDQVVAEYKLLNRQHAKEDEDIEEVPSLIHVIRRFVLEARKWKCFFIGSGQSVNSEILPTLVTDAMNSRIVFFNSDRKARMSGLEKDAIDTLLPQIRRGGSGIMIFDCARWEAPVIGAIPNITVDDMLVFLGVDRTSLSNDMRQGNTPIQYPSVTRTQPFQDDRETPDTLEAIRITSALQNTVEPRLEQTHTDTEERTFSRMDGTTEERFAMAYEITNNIDESLRKAGSNTRYREHARLIIRQRGLKREVK